MGRSPEAELIDLFSSLFSAEELRRWASLTFEREVTNALPESGVSLAELAFQLAFVLGQRGLVTDELFERLIEERPGRRDDILRVARLLAFERGWGVRELDLRESDFSTLSALFKTGFEEDAAALRNESRQLYGFFVRADKLFWDQLNAHLGPLFRRYPLVTIGIDLDSATVDPAQARRDLRLLSEDMEATDVVVVLVSADILGAAWEQVEELLLQTSARGIAIVPVVVRPCLWTDTPLVSYPVLPHGGHTVTTATNPDEVWLEVVEGVTAILEEAAPDMEGTPPVDESHQAATEEAALPLHGVQTSDVFRTTRMPTHTLVETQQLEELRHEMTVPGRLLVVEGPSGIGKTVAVKHAVDWVTTNGHRRWDATYLNVKDPSDVVQLDELLQRPTTGLRGYTIIDDFHDLDADRKRRLGRHAKVLADRDGQEAKLIFVGIPRVHESIMHEVPDLGARMTTVRIRRVEVAHIRELIEKGEHALNLRFTHKARLAVGAQGSFVIAQRLCENAVLKARIWQTASTRTQLGFDVPELLPTVIESLKGELYSRVQAFAMQDDGAESRGAALAVLWHLREADDGSLQLSYVRPRYPELHDAFELLLKNVAEKSGDAGWRSLFYCDPAGGQIAIEDPKLHFCLKHLGWEQLGRDCGVELRVLPDNGQLGFVPRQRTSTTIARNVVQSQQPGAQKVLVDGPVVRVLHLSDFHFRANTTWDASTVLGRLSVDIGRLVLQEGLAPDLIVLTGDVAYSGKAAEYDLARAWITKELLPAARLGSDRLVLVPGNHDADRSRVDFAVQQIGKGIRDERNQQRITEVLDGPAGGMLLLRLEAFMSFVNDLGAAGAPLVRPWYQAIFELEGITLHCAALASSWLSANDSDYGNLLLGLRQCNEVLAGADRADIVLVALHHPWDYVAEWDRRSSLAEIERSAGLVLRGHVHEAHHDYHQSVRHAGVLELAAGACYENSEHPNSYHLIELWPRAPRERRARVHVRYWDPARRDWRPDHNVFGTAWAELPLRVGA